MFVQLFLVEMERCILQVGLQGGEPRVEFGDAVAEAMAFGDGEESGSVVLLGALLITGAGVDRGNVLYVLDFVVIHVLNRHRESSDPLYKNTVNEDVPLPISR